MASGTLTSRILGLLRDLAMAALFDRSITDAWTAAFRLPNFFRRWLGEGALAVSFIPVFLEAQASDKSGLRSRNLVNAVYSLLLVFVGSLTLAGMLFMDPLLRLLLAQNYTLDLQRWEMTVRFGRIMFGFIFFVSTSAFYAGVLNSLGRFAVPAAAAALFNIAMLVFTFLPPSWFSLPGDGLAWGVLIGGGLQTFVLGLVLRSHGFFPRWQTWRDSVDVRAVLGQLGPGLLGMGLIQFSALVTLYYASGLPEGAVSYVYWADRLLELPLTLIAVSLGTALLPTLSAMAAQGNLRGFQETAEEALLMTIFWALPAALGLFFLAEPIIHTLFYRGHFTQQDVVATSDILRISALSLLFLSCSRVLMPLYHARKNTTVPMVLSLFCLILHLALAPNLIARWGLPGLMASSFFSAFINALLLFLGLPRWSVSLDIRRLVASFWKIALSGLCLSVCCQLYFPLSRVLGGSLQMISLLISIAIAGGVYFFVCWVLGCPQVFRLARGSKPRLN